MDTLSGFSLRNNAICGRKFDLDTQLKTSVRNLDITRIRKMRHSCSTNGVAKKSISDRYRTKLETIFDGVDTSFLHKKNKTILDDDISLKNRETGEAFEIKENGNW